MFQSTGKRKLIADVKKEKYAEMEPSQKKRCLSRKVQWFHSLDDTEKHKRNMRKKLNYGTSKQMTKDLDYYISSFQNKIKDGPFFICSVCNRLLYRKTVIQLKQSQYILQNLLLMSNRMMTNSTFVEHVIQKFAREKFHVKLYSTKCMLMPYHQNWQS